MRFKDLRKKLKEAFLTVPTMTAGYKVGPMDGDNSVDFNANLGDMSPKSIEKINIFLGAMSAKTYMDPVAAVNQMQRKLQTIGLFIDYKNQPLQPGENYFHISYLGGSYGMSPDSYEPTRDDGISKKTGYSVSLCVDVQKMSNGLTSLTAKVVADAPKESVSPDFMGIDLMGINTKPFTSVGPMVTR